MYERRARGASRKEAPAGQKAGGSFQFAGAPRRRGSLPAQTATAAIEPDCLPVAFFCAGAAEYEIVDVPIHLITSVRNSI